jgi:type VI secretion system secreted protein VgrG
MSTSSSSNLRVQVASGDAFDVREFFADEGLSRLFQVTIIAVAHNPNVDFEGAVGKQASFSVNAGTGERAWVGVCNELEQIGTEDTGLSTYRISIVPKLWLATQRRNHRMFQQMSEPEIVQKVLEDHEIKPELKIDQQAYKKRKYRVQYGESDFAFISRMLEDAGISYYFDPSAESKLVLSDAPQNNPPRGASIPFHEKPSLSRGPYATAVQMSRRLRPGKYTLRDHDYRRASDYELKGVATGQGTGVESKLERFHYVPGALLFRADEGEDTPAADDKGKTRALEAEGKAIAGKRLDAKRGPASRVRFATNVHELAPGTVMSIEDHPRSDLGGQQLLVVDSSFSGTNEGYWSQQCEAQSTKAAYRPALSTAKPKAYGTESATVVGPKGEEIHCDEFGRVRVQFHWDREGKMDDNSSCWIHSSQPWSGAGYGGINLPRVGQEVLVQFLGGDPDRPVIVGRVYTNQQKVPYKLPDHKTQSGWKTCSTENTGGYNEIMFEDEAKKELLHIRAERDMTRLVRHDENITIGNDRDLVVGRHLSKRVSENEREVTGSNRSMSVGGDRSAEIDGDDTTKVAGSYQVRIKRKNDDGQEDDGSLASITMDGSKIVLSTGQGAKITLDGGTVTIEGDDIQLRASSSITAKPPVEPG